MPAEHNQVSAKDRNMFSITDQDEEEQAHYHVAEKCEKIENNESNTQLKSRRGFDASSDDAMGSDNIFFMKHHDD